MVFGRWEETRRPGEISNSAQTVTWCSGWTPVCVKQQCSLLHKSVMFYIIKQVFTISHHRYVTECLRTSCSSLLCLIVIISSLEATRGMVGQHPEITPRAGTVRELLAWKKTWKDMGERQISVTFVLLASLKGPACQLCIQHRLAGDRDLVCV